MDQNTQPKFYIELYHGRKTPEENLEHWGTNGLCIGPLSAIHMTYFATFQLFDFADTEGESPAFLQIVQDLVYFDGVYYGDLTIFTDPADAREIMSFEQAAKIICQDEKDLKMR